VFKQLRKPLPYALEPAMRNAGTKPGKPAAKKVRSQLKRSVLNGYYQYHAVPGKLTVLSRFRRQLARYWFHAL
jgi:hypothetical protein